MPRPSCAPERRAQILDAFESCVIENGLDKTSTRMIAAAAGIKQPALHHYWGTREELVAALYHRVTQRYTAMIDDLFATHKGVGVDEFLDFLFMGPFAEKAGADRIMGELIGASGRDPAAKKVLDQIFATMETTTAGLLLRFFPGSDEPALNQTAYALCAFLEGHSILFFHHRDPGRQRVARQFAARIISRLSSTAPLP